MQSYPEVVGFDVNAETFRESAVEWKARSRNQDVLSGVREHSNGEVQGAGAPTAQHHILRTTVHNKRFRPQLTKHRMPGFQTPATEEHMGGCWYSVSLTSCARITDSSFD
jgi:hypothetical protein